MKVPRCRRIHRNIGKRVGLTRHSHASRLGENSALRRLHRRQGGEIVHTRDKISAPVEQQLVGTESSLNNQDSIFGFEAGTCLTNSHGVSLV